MPREVDGVTLGTRPGPMHTGFGLIPRALRRAACIAARGNTFLHVQGLVLQLITQGAVSLALEHTALLEPSCAIRARKLPLSLLSLRQYGQQTLRTYTGYSR